jgi:RecA-family ATPase
MGQRLDTVMVDDGEDEVAFEGQLEDADAWKRDLAPKRLNVTVADEHAVNVRDLDENEELWDRELEPASCASRRRAGLNGTPSKAEHGAMNVAAELDEEVHVFAARDDEPMASAPKHEKRTRTAGLPAKTVCLADVQAERVEWLWSQRIPLGMVTLIDGEPKLGKSTLALELAARVTAGSPMPGDSDVRRRSRAAVILMTGEDHLGATIRPRLDAAGADPAHVHALVAMPTAKDPDAPPMLTPSDIGRLEEAIRVHGARLVVIDPFMAYLPTDIDAYRDQDVRRAMRPLAAVAERTGAAIVIIRHLRKGAGSAIHRGGGSIGIAGAARAVLFVGVDPEDDKARVIAVAGMNLAPIAPSLRWRLVPAPGDVARVEWLGEADGVTADDLAAIPERQIPQDAEPDLIERAVTALRTMLESGPKSSKEAERDVIELTGASRRTFRRARERLGVQAIKTGKEWTLRLPENPKRAIPPTPRGAGILDDSSSGNGATSAADPPLFKSATSMEAIPERDALASFHVDEGA